MISVNLSASSGATGCHITCVEEKPCSSNSGGPSPPTRAKMRPDLVLIHFDWKPGNRSARSGIAHTHVIRSLSMIFLEFRIMLYRRRQVGSVNADDVLHNSRRGIPP